ncbi:hypothetical protein K469DRAFT_688403 [Zopfia rhizophila CBS 207.26]|uniref:Uncharacterized protein n=1 Tax=Zopfia rhizophila CBS 207.26 TaxID=1314779 RepID=A0A6A6E2I2_9PEZI|nr:hypothetical protein K469DRAFT_688403 [Zopfia rhizophila CBS 207.26]
MSMFQDIFAQYSSLAITNLEDRLVAISGLESRLAGLYETKYAYGVFDKPLHTSLLWQRCGDKSIEPINFGVRSVPLWFWMAYSGEVSYGTGRGWDRGLQPDIHLGLDIQNRKVLARLVRISKGYRIKPAGATNCTNRELRDAKNCLVGWIRFDNDANHAVESLACIVAKGTKNWNDYAGVDWQEELEWGEVYYVLLVSPAPSKQGDEKAYKRLGVAVIRGENLSFTPAELCLVKTITGPHYLKALINFVGQGHALRDHDDVPKEIREQLLLKEHSSTTSTPSYPSINITNVHLIRTKHL